METTENIWHGDERLAVTLEGLEEDTTTHTEKIEVMEKEIAALQNEVRALNQTLLNLGVLVMERDQFEITGAVKRGNDFVIQAKYKEDSDDTEITAN